MLKGVIASARRFADGGGAYVPGAVNFDGATSIKLASMSSLNSYDFSFFGFFRMSNWNVGFSSIWSVAPETVPSPTTLYVQSPAVKFSVTDASSYLDFETSNPSYSGWSPLIGNNVWVPIIGSTFTNAGADSKTHKMYFSDQDTGPFGTLTDGSSAFEVAFNGESFWVGDDSFGNYWTGDICNLSIWPGVSFLVGGDIPSATRRLFYTSSFNAVDPVTAVTALGPPAFMLAGGASTFANNSLGYEGPLSVQAGALTDASSTP